MEEIVYKLLWTFIEDISGIWESHWELNTILPERSKRENKIIAKKILKYFLEADLVNFYVGKWGSNDLKKLDLDTARLAFEEEKYWEPAVFNGLCLFVESTEKGEKAYKDRSLNFDSING